VGAYQSLETIQEMSPAEYREESAKCSASRDGDLCCPFEF
jgi:hypothetical protein